MKLPRSIRLAGKEFRFRFRRESSMPDVLGLMHGDKGLIDIRRGQPPYAEADTVVHEVFHAILDSQGREYGGDVEETYVRALATGLLGALHDNPEFAAWLTSTHPQHPS